MTAQISLQITLLSFYRLSSRHPILAESEEMLPHEKESPLRSFPPRFCQLLHGVGPTHHLRFLVSIDILKCASKLVEKISLRVLRPCNARCAPSYTTTKFHAGLRLWYQRKVRTIDFGQLLCLAVSSSSNGSGRRRLRIMAQHSWVSCSSIL